MAELVLAQWRAGGKQWPRPRFRVVFLTPSIERAHHILAVASDITSERGRHLVYAAPIDAYLTDPDPLFAPLFLDHAGYWRALIDLHPTAAFLHSIDGHLNLVASHLDAELVRLGEVQVRLTGTVEAIGFGVMLRVPCWAGAV